MTMRDRLSVTRKAVLAIRILYWYVRVRSRLRRHPLPDVVDWLGSTTRTARSNLHPRSLGSAVTKVLPFGGATCLVRSLVLLRLLHESGFTPDLQVGLLQTPINPDAHAWLELGGVDVGPPPGRAGHIPLVCYRAGAPPRSVTGDGLSRSR